MRNTVVFTLIFLFIIFALFAPYSVSSQPLVSFAITNRYDWETALSAIRTGGNNRSYVITVNGNLTGTNGVYGSTNTFGSATGIAVTLMGSGTLGIYYDGSTTAGRGSLVQLRSGQELIIDDANLTLKGRDNNSSSLIYIDGGTLTLKAGRLIDNSAPYPGGGVYIWENSTFNMTGGEISNNYCNGNGGGVTVHGTFNMTGGEITGNSSSSNGAGVYIVYGIFTMKGGKISNNNTSASGGGVYMATMFGEGTSIFTMEGGEISGNIARNDGGGAAIYNNGSVFTMTGGQISGNTANGGGGGVNVDNRSTFAMTGGEIKRNSALFGGGVRVDNNAYFSKTRGIIYGTDAGDDKNIISSALGNVIYWSYNAAYYRNLTLYENNDLETDPNHPNWR